MARNPFAAAAAGLQPRAALYQGADFDRLNADWRLSRLSADMTVRFDLQTLRNRSRELIMNCSAAAAVPGIFSENIVGKDGIVLQPNVMASRGHPNDRVNGMLAEAWAAWGEVGTCTVDGRASWVDVQRLLTESECVDGEVLIRHVRGFDNPFGYALEIIDPDQLDPYFNVTPSPGQNAIVMGVEQDRWGRPVAYHLWTAHPTDPQAKHRERVPADQIEHLYIQRRPRQSRGLPWLAPVIFDLKMLGAYRDAELTAARTSAAKMGFLRATNPDGTVPPLTPKQGDDAIIWETEAGVIEQLPTGYDFVGWDPKHPSTAFEGFDKAILRGIASALRVAYMSLTGDLNNTSFGSGRIGLLAERAVYQAAQQRVIRRLCTPIYRAWLKEALLAGALPGLGFDPARYQTVLWHPRPFPWIDPVKDMELAERSLAMGIDSRTRLAAEQGRDFRTVILDQKAEIAWAKEHDVPLITSFGGGKKSVSVDEVQQSEEDSGQAPADEADDADAPPSTPPKKGARVLRAVAGDLA